MESSRNFFESLNFVKESTKLLGLSLWYLGYLYLILLNTVSHCRSLPRERKSENDHGPLRIALLAWHIKMKVSSCRIETV